jgi:hypothetical protein
VITGPAVTYTALASSSNARLTPQLPSWQKEAVPRNGSAYRDTLAFTPRCPRSPRSIEASNPNGPLPWLKNGDTAWSTMIANGTSVTKSALIE